MIYIGIDPGKSGAVAVISKDKMTVTPTPMLGKEYNIRAMDDLLLQTALLDKSFCVIERAQAMPRQGVVSMFSFGMGYGIWLGLLASNTIPYQIIHSRVWTKQLLAGAPGERKERNIIAAKRLFPSWSPKLKKELLYSDAILLAEYARRLNDLVIGNNSSIINTES